MLWNCYHYFLLKHGIFSLLSLMHLGGTLAGRRCCQSVCQPDRPLILVFDGAGWPECKWLTCCLAIPHIMEFIKVSRLSFLRICQRMVAVGISLEKNLRKIPHLDEMALTWKGRLIYASHTVHFCKTWAWNLKCESMLFSWMCLIFLLLIW